MAEEIKNEVPEVPKKTRRAFVTTAAQVAVTAPAVAMLLSASTKPAAAQVAYAIDDGSAVGNDICSGGTFVDATVGCPPA